MLKQKEKYNIFVKELKSKIDNNDKKILVMCIGSNKIIGDSFGPLVGTNLNKLLKDNNKVNVLGNMENPINAKNIGQYIYNIKNCYVIAIDSAIAEKEFVGEVFVNKDKMTLGKGVEKNILQIGDISIKCCVTKNKYNNIDNLKSLQKVSERFIEDKAHMVSLGIYEAILNI